MRPLNLFISVSAAVLAVSTGLIGTFVQAKNPFYYTLDDYDNFIVADGFGPERWGCSFVKTQVHPSPEGTTITIGTDSDLKPYSCGELISKEDDLSYGVYSIDMISSNVVGQVTAFFLIANGESEIDIELTGLNPRIGWMNVWDGNHQNPISLDLGFDASEDWHTYSFEWRPNFIAWSVDGQVVLNRTDIPTRNPQDTQFKLAINSWTQVNKEINIDWAGKFQYPEGGDIPKARFRNMQYYH